MTYICSLQNYVQLCGHPCIHAQDWLAIERVVVYYARAVHAFSTGPKCWHCMSLYERTKTTHFETFYKDVLV